MNLIKLDITNFKKYRSVNIEFQEGLTGIVGSNGSGKSTIVEAIAWALYGNIIYKNKNIDKKFLKNSKASDSERVEVRLILEMENHELSIFRAMKSFNLMPEACLSIDNEEVANSTKGVDERLKHMLRTNYQDFMKTFYARQKELDNLVKEAGINGKREYFLKLLGLEDVKDMFLDHIKSDKNDQEGDIKMLDGALNDIGDVDTRMKATYKDISVALSDLEEATGNAAILAKIVDKCKKDLEFHAEKRRSYELLAERSSRLVSSISEKNAASKEDEVRLAEIQGLKNLLADLGPKLGRLEITKSRLSLLEPLQKKHEELYRNMTGFSAELEGTKRLLKEREDRRLELQKESVVLEEIRPRELEFHLLQERLEKLELLKDRHSEHQIRLKEERTRLYSAETAIARTEADINVLLKAKSRKDEIEPLKIKFSWLKDELALASSQKEKKKVLDDLVERKVNLEARKNRLLESASISHLEISAIGDLVAKQSELMKLEINLDRLGTDLNNGMSELRSECSVYQSRKNEASRNLARVRSLGADGSCPTCERPLGEQRDMLLAKYELAVKEAETGISGLKAKIQYQQDKIDGVSSTRSNLKKAFDELNAKKTKLSGLEASLRGTEVQAKEVTAELNEIVRRIEDLGEVQFDLDQFEDISAGIEELLPIIDEYVSLAIKLEELPKKKLEIEELEKERQRLALSSDDLSTAIKALNYDDAEHISARKRSAELKPAHDRFTSISQRIDEIPALCEKNAALKKELEKLQVTLEYLNKAIEDLGFNRSEYDELLNERRSLSKVEDEANKIRLRLAAEPEIRRRMEEIARALTDLEKELQKTKEQIAALGYNQDIHREAIDALSKAEEGHEVARKEASEKEISLGVLNGEMQRLEGDATRKKE
ncbi:MAG: SMC family ATPase, partial [Methanothrix sp.]|nr:SMC family ATPase [Methanothrix sp.]